MRQNTFLENVDLLFNVSSSPDVIYDEQANYQTSEDFKIPSDLVGKKKSPVKRDRRRSRVICVLFPTCRVGSRRGVGLAAVSRHAGGVDRGPRRIHVGFLLELADVFLVSDSLVAEPVWHLGAKARGARVNWWGCYRCGSYMLIIQFPSAPATQTKFGWQMNVNTYFSSPDWQRLTPLSSFSAHRSSPHSAYLHLMFISSTICQHADNSSQCFA